MSSDTIMQTLGQQARAASRLMAKADCGAKDHALFAIAESLQASAMALIKANEKDLRAKLIWMKPC